MRLPLNFRLNGRLRQNHWKHSCLALIALVATGTGCKNGFIDPGEMGRYSKSLPVPILRVLDAGIDEPDPKWRNATAVTAEDMQPTQGDYVLGRNDYVAILITDLVAPNVESVVQKRISESGKVSLPLIGQIQAAGLTEAQLETAINQAYKDAGLIQNATVSVSVLEARNRTYTISGAVGAPGEYQILASDFRLLNALNYARNVTSTGIDYVYIIRKQEPGTGAGGTGGAGTAPTTRPNTDVLMPRGAANHNMEGAIAEGVTTQRRVSMLTQPADVPPTPATDPTTQQVDPEGRVITIEGRPVTTDQPPATDMSPVEPAPGAETTTPEPPVQPVTPTDYRAAGTFQFEPPPQPTDVRLIRVPLEALTTHGDLRYNIVIRPGDMIIVPNPVIGEYYMGGHVARVGVYSLTARKITLKMAVISAGMLDQVAIPQRTQIVRRLEGQDREFFAIVDLAKIFAGEAPDVYLKPDDQVMVGTNFVAPFIAAVRNGFRITYGFGFLYDRNYNDEDNNNN